MDNQRKFLDNIFVYYKILDDINKYLNKIINNNFNGNPHEVEEWFYLITSELMRLFPIEYNRKTKMNEISINDGILLLKDEIPFIVDKFNKIYSTEIYKNIFNDIMRIRNKFIHEPHNINYVFSVGSNTSCSMGLYYKNELLNISTISLGSIIQYINKTFTEIDKIILKYLDEDDKLKSYPCYNKFIEMIEYRKGHYYTILPEYIILNF